MATTMEPEVQGPGSPPPIDWARLRAGMRKASAIPQGNKDYNEAQLFLQQAQGLLKGHIAELQRDAGQYTAQQENAAPDLSGAAGGVGSSVMGLAQGATIGQGDRLHGMAQVLAGLPDIVRGQSTVREQYALGKGNYDQAYDAAGTAHPYLRTAGDVVGSGAAGGLLQAGVLRAVPVLGDVIAAG